MAEVVFHLAVLLFGAGGVTWACIERRLRRDEEEYSHSLERRVVDTLREKQEAEALLTDTQQVELRDRRWSRWKTTHGR